MASHQPPSETDVWDAALTESGSHWSLGGRLRPKRKQRERDEEPLEEEQGRFVQLLALFLVVTSALVDLWSSVRLPCTPTFLCSSSTWSETISELTQEATLVAFAYFHFRHRHSLLAPFTLAAVLFTPVQAPRILSIIMAALFPVWACVNQRVLALDFLPGLKHRTTNETNAGSTSSITKEPNANDSADSTGGSSSPTASPSGSPSSSPSASESPRPESSKTVAKLRPHEQLRKCSLAVPFCSALIALFFRDDERLVRLHAGICFAVVVVMLMVLRITFGRFVRVFSGIFAIPAVFQLLHLLLGAHSNEVDALIQVLTTTLFLLVVCYDLYRSGMKMAASTRELSNVMNTQIETVRNEHQRQLATKLELLAKLSEKVRTPLLQVMSSVRMLHAANLSDEQKELVRVLDQGTMQLQTLSKDITNIVEAEGKNQLAIAPFNLMTTIEAALEIASLEVRQSDVDLVSAVDSNVPLELVGDGLCIRHVLIELISHCLKSPPPVGEVKLSVLLAKPPTDTDRVSLSFRVNDNSRNASESAADSDLALSYCNQLVHLLGSSLKIESTKNGQSLSFEVTLPLDRNPPPTGPNETFSISSMNVLVIDDSRSYRQLLSKELASCGCRIETASDSTEGQRMLQLSVTSGINFDLLIIDNQLGTGVSGIETANKLREDPDYANLLVVIMLAPAERERADVILRNTTSGRAIRFIQKPIKRKDLLMVLSEASEKIMRAKDERRFSNSSSSGEGLPPVLPGRGSRLKRNVSRGHALIGGPSPIKRSNLLMSKGIAMTQVLLVEDDATIQQEILTALGGLGCITKAVSLAETAINETINTPYDVIMIDVSSEALHAMDTINTIRSLQKKSDDADSKDNSRTSYVIAFTRKPSEQEKQSCLDLKMDNYIELPITSEKLELVFAEVVPLKTAPISIRKSSDQVQSSPSPDLNSSNRAVRSRAQLEKVLQIFVPKEFQEIIAPNRSLDSVQLGDAELRCITILFSDIRDFTSITEKMYVKEVMKFINTYLAFAMPALSSHRGFVDKFIGDAIMAIFAQADLREQAVAAVRAAVKVQRDLDFMSTCGFRAADTGIGINTGRTIMGFIGTETRMSPTVLGDAVNLASRTESMCKSYGARILITEHTLKQMGTLKDEFHIRLVDNVTVKGKDEPCKVYEVIDGDRDEVLQKKLSILPMYNSAMQTFISGKFADAISLFNQCLELMPDDKPCALYLQRCKELIRSPPIDWTGVYRRDEK